MSAAPSVKLHIESLVLDGLGDVSRSALVRAIQAELTQRFGAAGADAAPWTTGHRAHVDGGEIHASAETPAARLGVQIGAAVHRGITGR
ncbi:MAG: hypothetical protein L0271_15900 [Gemmatimonadetes bacterium]|nr:hypothetical protein [Gemmatimonadota bacterium]